jgi:hypothetical protein
MCYYNVALSHVRPAPRIVRQLSTAQMGLTFNIHIHTYSTNSYYIYIYSAHMVPRKEIGLKTHIVKTSLSKQQSTFSCKVLLKITSVPLR